MAPRLISQFPLPGVYGSSVRSGGAPCAGALPASSSALPSNIDRAIRMWSLDARLPLDEPLPDLPRQQCAHDVAQLRVGADAVAQLGRWILCDAGHQSRYFDRVALRHFILHVVAMAYAA